MITEFIVCGNHPFSTVEQEKFKIIIDKGFPNRRSLTRKTLMSRVSTNAENIRKNVKDELISTNVKHVCATADCWSVFKK